MAMVVCRTCGGSGRVLVSTPRPERDCLACGREFLKPSIPRYVVDQDYRVLGRVHTSCAVRYERDHPGADTVNLAGEVALDPRWLVWISRQDRGELGGNTNLARTLGWQTTDMDGNLNPDQEGLIQHWITGGLGLDPARMEPIKEEYRRLVREFLERIGQQQG